MAAWCHNQTLIRAVGTAVKQRHSKLVQIGVSRGVSIWNSSPARCFRKGFMDSSTYMVKAHRLG
jgi:hypothetical protein